MPEQRFAPSGVKMIKSAQIKHFKCFEAASLSNCARINVVVGANGSGKTALLEALFLLRSMSAAGTVQIRQWRGLEGNFIGTARSIQEAMWGDFFHNFDKSVPVQIEADGARLHTTRFTISHDLASDLPLDSGIDRTDLGGIIFEWTRTNGKPYTYKPDISAGNISFPAQNTVDFETFFFAANHTYSPTETAMRFSSLRKLSNEGPVIDFFKNQFSEIEDLSVELQAGMGLLYAKVKHLRERIPLNNLSGGVNKLAAILCAICSQKGGIVIIDEIENGIYYQRLPAIWEALLAFAKDNNTQIFASTHSGECLQAAAMLAEKNPAEFGLIQAATKDGKRELWQFQGDRFASAVQNNVEIR